MPGFLASTLIAFIGVVALVEAVGAVLVALVMVGLAQKGDLPIKLSTRRFAFFVLTEGILVGWLAVVLLASVSS